MRQPSIRRQLMVWVLGALSAGALILAFAAYALTLGEIDEVLDDGLRQTALLLADRDLAGALPAGPVEHLASSADTESKLVAIARRRDGSLLFTSEPEMDLRFEFVAGQSLQTARDERWHVFTVIQGERIVQVAQPVSVRRELAAESASQLLVPLLGLVAMIGAMLVLALRRGLQPLNATTDALALRGAASLAPLEVDKVPKELLPMVRTLNELLVRLAAAFEAQRHFVADAAHELRTPLAGMTAYLEVAANHPDLIEPSTLVDRLLSANSHLSDLVNDLLTLAILDAKAPIKYRPVCLAGIVQDGMRHLDAAKIRVEERIVGPAMVLGNPTHLTRVVTNLVGNAIRHATSAVVVTVHTTEAHAVFTVIDDGPGIPAEHRYRIWQRFVRFDDDRARATGGTGLGLALVREIVTAHGGGVRVGDAAPGPGAVFAARIPLVSLGQAAPRPAAAQPSATALTRDDSRPSVLLQQP